MFGALIDYWYYTGDDHYNEATTQALLFQVGEYRDYMPRNQTLTEGNDDQGFWGLAVMSAAEYNYPNPPADQPQWLALAQAVFNTQAPRWDMQHCNGGLRWQIFEWNKGYNYKNSISMACFFALGARLALYTGNQTYAEWAEVTWDWMIGAGFLNPDNYFVYDGAHIETNCTDIVPYQWSYNAGGFLHGAAAMYNMTGSETWKKRVDKLLKGIEVFFRGPDKNIMTEVACEPVDLCNVDQQSFKAYLSRWLAVTTKWAPWTYDRIKGWLKASANAAIKTCVAGENGRLCGMKWSSNVEGWDPADLTGVGQQMAAMEVVIANLIDEVKAPLSSDTGGTSPGNPAAGSEDIGVTRPRGFAWGTINTVDRVGAWVLTVVILLFFMAAIVFMVVDDSDHASWQKRKTNLAGAIICGRGIGLPRIERRKHPEVQANVRNIGTPDSSLDVRSSSSFEKDTTAQKDHKRSIHAINYSAAGAVGAVKTHVLSHVGRRRSQITLGARSFEAVGHDRAHPDAKAVFPPIPERSVKTRNHLPSSRSISSVSGSLITSTARTPSASTSHSKLEQLYSPRHSGQEKPLKSQTKQIPSPKELGAGTETESETALFPTPTSIITRHSLDSTRTSTHLPFYQLSRKTVSDQRRSSAEVPQLRSYEG